MSQLERLSKDFRESLEAEMEKVLIKKAQCGMPGPVEDQAKLDLDAVKKLLSEFLDRVMADWLMGLDDAKLQEVKAKMETLSGVSTSDFIEKMKASGMTCPFCLLGEIFGGKPKAQMQEEVEVVEMNPEPSHEGEVRQGPGRGISQEEILRAGQKG